MQPEAQKPNQPPTGWQFAPNQPNAINTAQPDQPNTGQSEDFISWSASEFIAYQKSKSWYVVAIIILLVLTGIIYLITNDEISSGATFMLGMLFIIFASRQPRVLNYKISNQGISIGEKLYTFRSMRSFAVIEEESMRSIDVLPLQRFMPAISMYYDPKDEDIIITTLGKYLPRENRKQPLIDKLMHKIRF